MSRFEDIVMQKLEDFAKSDDYSRIAQAIAGAHEAEVSKLRNALQYCKGGLMAAREIVGNDFGSNHIKMADEALARGECASCINYAPGSECCGRWHGALEGE